MLVSCSAFINYLTEKWSKIKDINNKWYFIANYIRRKTNV
jgi:hypothetical protein